MRITSNFEQVIGRLNRAVQPATVDAVLRKAMYRNVVGVHGRVVAKLSGEVLRVDEDFLRGQMQFEVSPDGRQGWVGTNLIYAAIHEFGGVTPPHAIEVRDFDSAMPISVLASKVSTRGAAGIIFRARVQHPGAVVPQRPYLRPSLAENREEILANTKDALKEMIQ